MYSSKHLFGLVSLLTVLLISDGAPMTRFAFLGSGRIRAGSPDPSCTNRTLLTALPPIITNDNFYKEVTKDYVHILAMELDLDENTPPIDPCKDLYLEAVTLRIKGHLRWKAANIYISAVNVTVVGGQATLDVSYQSPGAPNFSPGQAAPSGAAGGDPGQAGAAGGVGGPAGNATLYLGFVHNGTLEVLAEGGSGGRGQDGGDGHEGVPGKSRTEVDPHACCHHSRTTQGLEGGKGGDAGAAGKSGDGGTGGVITIYTLDGTLQKNSTNGSMANITVPLVTGNVEGGNSGQPATPGKPGAGGPGGLGSPTHCKDPTFGHHSCHGALGPTGPPGPAGNPAPPTPNGTVGAPGVLNIYHSDMDYIGEHVSSELIQMALREANKQYRNSEFEAARDIYVWISLAMSNSTDPERKGYAHKAAVMLIQMSKGLDYWAHSLNNMPMNSYKSIFDYLNNYILPYLKDVETEYRIYFSAAQNDTRKLEIARNLINHNKFTMNVIEKNKQDLLSELQHAQSELEHLIHEQTMDERQAEGMIAVCQNAIQNEIEKEKSRFSFKEIFTIAKACVKIYAAFYTGGVTLDSGVDDLGKAISAFEGLDGSFIDKLMDLDQIKTIVKNFHLDKDLDTITGSWDDIVKNYREIEDEIKKHGQENSAKIFTDGSAFDKQYDKWLYLSECSDAKLKLQKFLNMSQAVNDKIMHHDAIVVKLATIDAEAKVIEHENARLQSQMTKDWDPNLIQYSIAVGRVLYNLKDAFVDQMKRLHESFTYQFLERRPFAYDDSTVAMFEAWMANNMVNRLQRMEQIGNQVEQFNVDPEPLENSIILRRKDHPEAFKSLDSNGNFTFVLTGAEDQLSTMTHAHMTDVRVWLPGAELDSNHMRIWLKRYGTSQVYDQQGNPWTFTHGARTMLFDYSTVDHSKITHKTKATNLKQNTRVEINEDKSDYVALSPIGPWSLSISKRYNPGLDTTKVDAIYLQLSYSFLPCAQPECPIRSRQNSKADETMETDLVPAKHASDGDDGNHSNSSTAGTAVGVVIGVLVTIVVIVLIIVYFKKRRMYTQIGNTYDQI